VFHSGRSGLPPAQYGQQLAHAGFAPNAAVWPQPSQYPGYPQAHGFPQTLGYPQTHGYRQAYPAYVGNINRGPWY
jgi:hypothetical protein